MQALSNLIRLLSISDHYILDLSLVIFQFSVYFQSYIDLESEFYTIIASLTVVTPIENIDG
jgi:hypothetical protein